MTTTRTRRPNARIGWLATTFALAIALVVGSWLNYRGARAAVSPLNRGQADLLELAIREVVRPGATVDTAELRAFLESHQEAGLRYVALLASDGEITASVGDPAVPPTLPVADTANDSGRPIVAVGDRVRAYFPRPPVRGESGDRGFGDRRRRPDESEPDRELPTGEPRQRPRTAYHLLEFEPVVASDLVAQATRSFVLSCIGAGILTLAAVGFWRTSGRYEQAMLRLEEQRRLTLLGEMSAVLAHEIRNPLASLKGHAQLLAERLPDESREKTRADRVVSEATRLEALTSDLLDFARSGPLELTPADPVELLHAAVADVDPDGFTVDVEDAPERWTMDVARIRQALVNVLQNAHQASADGSPPRVRLAREKSQLVFEVRDSGPGLPPGSETRIFDPFFTTRTNGTGLGLAVARRVTEMHGGGITATNHPDGGAVFRIVLPSGA